jgi:hypothetical protein
LQQNPRYCLYLKHRPCEKKKIEVRFQVLTAASIALMMEAASTSETSVNFYQTTRRNNSEGRHLQEIGGLTN